MSVILRDDDFNTIMEYLDGKPVEAVANIKTILEDYAENKSRFPLGSYVVDIEDNELTDVAIVAYDHMVHGYDLYSIRRLDDKHLSTRDHAELKQITPEQATKAWCGSAIEYGD